MSRDDVSVLQVEAALDLRASPIADVGILNIYLSHKIFNLLHQVREKSRNSTFPFLAPRLHADDCLVEYIILKYE